MHHRMGARGALAVVVALGGLALLGPSCTADTSGLGDDDDGAGQGGASGEGGAGAAGAPPAGNGGAGGGGRGGSAGEANCDRARLVVVQPGFDAKLDPALAGACRFASLDDALAVLAPGAQRLAIYGQNASAAAPLVLPAGLTFEGHAADPAQPLALAVKAAAAGAPLLTLGAGSTVKGVALEGPTVEGEPVPAGVRVASGAVRLEGPLRLRRLSLALSVEGTATATVVGTKAAPVLVSGNARGVVVAPGAGLELTGEGGASVVLEKTSKGAALLVEKGDGSDIEITVSGVLVQDNRGSSGLDGTGGIEVRKGRQVAVRGCVFERNVISVCLNGEKSSVAASFSGLSLENNLFRIALPSAGSGSALCGSNLGAVDTQLTLGAGNVFPSGAVSGAATCAALNDGQEFGCDAGGDVAYDAPDNDLALTCQ